MQTFYLDTTAGNWYDERGDMFRSNQPSMAFQTQDELRIIAVTGSPEAETESINPAIDWPRDTQWSGMAARIAVDNDTIHRIKGSLAEPVTDGANSRITATIANASQATIPGDGKLTIYAADSTSEIISYSSREINGTSVVFTLVEGEEIRKSYPAGSVMDCPQSPYCSAMMNPDKSNPLAGEFAFDLVVDSRRLREEMLYTSKDRLPVKGLELLFYRETETATVPVRAFLLSTFSITGLLNDVNAGADLPESEAENRLYLMVNTMLSAGFDVELYNSATGSWEAYSDSAIYSTSYTKYRFRLASAGDSGVWATVPLIHGTGGGSGGGTDYSGEINALNQRVTALEQSVGGVEANLEAIIG